MLYLGRKFPFSNIHLLSIDSSRYCGERVRSISKNSNCTEHIQGIKSFSICLKLSLRVTK